MEATSNPSLALVCLRLVRSGIYSLINLFRNAPQSLALRLLVWWDIDGAGLGLGAARPGSGAPRTCHPCCEASCSPSTHFLPPGSRACPLPPPHSSMTLYVYFEKPSAKLFRPVLYCKGENWNEMKSLLSKKHQSKCLCLVWQSALASLTAKDNAHRFFQYKVTYALNLSPRSLRAGPHYKLMIMKCLLKKKKIRHFCIIKIPL